MGCTWSSSTNSVQTAARWRWRDDLGRHHRQQIGGTFFKVEDGVKINSAGYTQFLEKNLMPWMKEKSAALKKNMVFMQDSAPSHASKFTREWLAKKGIKEDHMMTWPPASPDLNPIENY